MAYVINNGKMITSSGKFLTAKVFNDWFLPSSSGLLQMKLELHDQGVGGFTPDGYYWASSEHSSLGVAAAVLRFSPSSGIIFQQKNTSFNMVRAARSFTDSIGSYALRDTGPAGGLIFAIDGTGTIYYEASPSDVSASSIWSNVTVLIGGLGTTLGTGLANSQAIIDQDGHTTSAAKLCLELSVSA